MASAANFHRVAKNTVVLYFRMMFQMVVSLYTSRVVLQVLGETDFGIYDVTAGIVTILVFLNNSMAVASQRFITFALGKEDDGYLRRVYSASLLTHICLAVIILILGETVGLWYVLNCLVVPAERMAQAMIVYQCSLLSSIVLIICVPYTALIIAHERMTAYAGITILDVLLNLALVLSLRFWSQDRLVVYALLLLGESVFIRLGYYIYCRVSFHRVYLVLRGVGANLFREMISFGGWSMFGNFALVCNIQGINLVLNGVGGPVINAARGIAFRVQTAIMAFISSFQTAINPQITKCYAQQDVPTMNSLILRSSKFSFILMLFVAIPMMLEASTVLKLWLHDVPQHTVGFTRLLLAVSMLDCVSNSMMVGAAATGNIRRYHTIIGTTLAMALPLAYYLVKIEGMCYEMAFVSQLLMVLLAQFIRQYLCRSLYQFSNRAFFAKVLLPLMEVSVLSVILPFWIHTQMPEGIIRLLLVVVATVLSVIISVGLLGLDQMERVFIVNKILRR